MRKHNSQAWASDLELNRQLRTSLQVSRREERIKGIFFRRTDFKVQARCSGEHQGTGGDPEMLGSTETSFPSHKEHLDSSQEFIFMFTDSKPSLGFSFSGLEAL